MTNQSTALEGGAMPSSVKFKPLTTRDVDKVLKAMEYDMAKERVEPFERFAFSVNEEGIPEICELPGSGDDTVRH